MDVSQRANVLTAVEGLLDRARTLEDLEDHGLQLLAARRWRALGRGVPARVVAQERAVAATALAAPAILARIRAACDGDLVLLKGPETAAAYPDPLVRSYGDIDLLTLDAHATQRELIQAGFQPVGDERRYQGIHHLRPLRVPQLPLLVEVHHAANWPGDLEPPSAAELIEAGVPARCGVQGILGLPPAHHAVVLAGHAWCHAPLGHLRQLLDIALVAADAKPADLDLLAERWGASRLWKTTVGALDALFGGMRFPLTLRLWARHLVSVRERTVFEGHLKSWVSPMWCLPPSKAVRAGVAALAADLRPSGGERWRDKAQRTRLALANATTPAPHHVAMLKKLQRDREGAEAPEQRRQRLAR
jgi:Uncharacterised nucleotidyltransferase